MSSNYPEGSMMGSGIYVRDWSGSMYCVACEEWVAVEGVTNDWNTMAYADCPDCGAELDHEIESDDEANQDALYDEWRDSQYE